MLKIKSLPESTKWLETLPDMKESQNFGRYSGLEGKIKMTPKNITVQGLPAFDTALYLESDETIAAYLTDILEANDAGLLAAALGTIARVRGMSEIAKSAGITREALYKALRPGSAPRFDTVNRVCGALGVRLVVQVAPAATL
jgi:probable addiction module antidote protein